MYISGFHLDGFGIYHDQGVQDLPPGLVLFVGDNESGKTTLMEFLRTLLCGFPRRAPKRNDYEPLRGGNHGGRLQVVMHDGRHCTIERAGRHPATLTQAGGTTMQAEPGLTLLGGLDRETFKHVFAVGLDELQGLGVLSQEGVRGRLLAAGTGLGSASVPEVMKNLDKESDTLLKKGGRTQRINLLLNDLKRIEHRLREVQGQAAAYAEGQRQREYLEARVDGNRQEVEGRRRELGRVERLEQARVPWSNRNLAREKAVEVEYAQNFPVNGLERLEGLHKELDANRQSRKQREGEVAGLKEQLGRLTPDEAVLAGRDVIEALAGERDKLAQALEDYPAAKGDLDQAQTEFGRKLRELGPAWDGPRLAAVDTSVQVRQRVAEFGRQLNAAERRFEAARVQERALAEAAAETQKQAEAAVRHSQDLPAPRLIDNQELARQQEAVRRLRAWLQQREVLTEKHRGRASARDEAGARLAALQGQLAAPTAALSAWLCLPWLLAGLGLGGFFLWRRDYLTGGLIAGVGLVLAGLFFWLSRRQAAVEGQRRAAMEQELEQVEGNRAGLSEAITDLEGQIEAAEAEIARAAQIMDREPPGDLIGLEEMAGELEQAAAQLRDWQAREQERRQAEDHLAQAGARLAKAQAETKQAYEDLKRLQDEWAGWLTDRGFSEAVRPEGFEAVLQAVENARAASRVLDHQSRRVQQMSGYIAAARERIGQGLRACGRTPVAAEPGVGELDALRRALAAALAASQQQRGLTEKLAAATQALDILNSRGQELEREGDDLLRQAGAADAEDFRRRGVAYAEWQRHIQQISTEETALYRMAGTREAQAALEEELSHTDPLELQEEKERLQARLSELSSLISADDQEIGDLKGKLKSMEQDEQLSDLLFQQRLVQEQLTDATRRWATLVVCRHLLEEARGVYERERQPQVIREADRFLNTMAHGRYRLLAAMGQDGVHLEDKSLARKEEVAWSAGLADQVYLSIRLGLAREFGRHSEPVPVILDDVLVKFDPSRRRNAARVILDFAREQQVLLFSCHPEFIDLIAAVRQDPVHQETALACFAIADGVISRVSMGPDDAFPRQ
ncbi:MAG: AAA family ATPase [Deltaproteobacteria bacterium]|nr:AAA family ATPase [Deltaproteobacteria bacterium]